MLRSPVGAFAILGLAGGLILQATQPAEAARQGRVSVQSHYGHGTVTGAVRRRGRVTEVQLPSGFWEDCEGDCAETLRRKSVDFWRTIDEEAPDGGRD